MAIDFEKMSNKELADWILENDGGKLKSIMSSGHQANFHKREKKRLIGHAREIQYSLNRDVATKTASIDSNIEDE